MVTQLNEGEAASVGAVRSARLSANRGPNARKLLDADEDGGAAAAGHEDAIAVARRSRGELLFEEVPGRSLSLRNRFPPTDRARNDADKPSALSSAGDTSDGSQICASTATSDGREQQSDAPGRQIRRLSLCAERSCEIRRDCLEGGPRLQDCSRSVRSARQTVAGDPESPS